MNAGNEIEIANLTKDYGAGKGIFDVNLSVNKGEVFGFLGPNGAGKTTTIRNLMGFIRPDAGRCSIRGMDCFGDASKIEESLGYLAGEIAFLDDMKGEKLMNFIAAMKGMKDKRKMQELIDRFELDCSGKVKKMSKGMKQKMGLVMAFMNEPEILILDEPTSGLDPLMQSRFIDLILEEKKKGTTIFMSSHMFEEIERTCDRTAIIKDGRIVYLGELEELKRRKRKDIILTFPDEETAGKFRLKGFAVKERSRRRVTVSAQGGLQELFTQLASWPVEDIETRTQTLEDLFLHFYDEREGSAEL